MNFRIEHPRLLVGALCVMVAFLAGVIHHANSTLDRANIELAFCRQAIFGGELPPIVPVWHRVSRAQTGAADSPVLDFTETSDPLDFVETADRFLDLGTLPVRIDGTERRMLAIENEQRRMLGQQNDLERRMRALEDNFLFEAHCRE